MHDKRMRDEMDKGTGRVLEEEKERRLDDVRRDYGRGEAGNEKNKNSKDFNESIFRVRFNDESVFKNNIRSLNNTCDTKENRNKSLGNIKPHSDQNPFKNSDLYDLTNLQNKLKFVKEKIEESEKMTIFEEHYTYILKHMRERVKKEVFVSKASINGDQNKTHNSLVQEIENIDLLMHEMKRIIFLKETRDNLTKI